jgi:hypothetical protein
MNIYLSCGLTHVPRNEFENYTSFIHSVAEHLTKFLNSDVKYALKNSDPQLADREVLERAEFCYKWDREMVEWADLVVAECSYPSTGVGIELQIAEQKNIPIIICFFDSEFTAAKPIEYVNPDGCRHKLQIGGGHVTLMALGMPNIVEVIAYTSASDGLKRILEACVKPR